MHSERIGLVNPAALSQCPGTDRRYVLLATCHPAALAEGVTWAPLPPAEKRLKVLVQAEILVQGRTMSPARHGFPHTQKPLRAVPVFLITAKVLVAAGDNQGCDCVASCCAMKVCTVAGTDFRKNVHEKHV